MIGSAGSALEVGGVAAFSVPEQPHTDKPFLRPPEMMLECVGDEKGGRAGVRMEGWEEE